MNDIHYIYRLNSEWEKVTRDDRKYKDKRKYKNHNYRLFTQERGMDKWNVWYMFLCVGFHNAAMYFQKIYM